MSEGIGAPVKRKEDKRFLTGSGRYTDDIQMENQAYAAFVRSPHAHSMVKGIDKSAAEAMPGVLAVLDGKQLTGDGIGNIICGWAITSKDGSPMNMVYDWEIGEKDPTDAALAGAAHVTEMDLTNNRLSPNAMEPRAAITKYDAAEDHYTLYTTSQNPHVARLVLSAFYQVAPEHKLRVIAPDVGGGFGSKIYIYPEEIVCLWAAMKTKRSIKWTADRTEAFLTDAHGRDHVTNAKMGFDADGNIVGFKVSTKANFGAYMSLFSSAVPTYLYATLLSGTYNIPNIYCEVLALYTNTVPIDAYRGAGRPEASYLVERMMETAARELGRDPADLRRQNFVREFPHQTPVIMNYDSGDFEGNLNQAMEAADWNGFDARKAESAARGKLRGIGMACYIEACGIAPSAAVGSGSRSGPVGMSAIAKALDKVEIKVKKIGAHLLEEPEENIVIEDGQVKATGTNKALGWHEIGLAAYTAHNLPADMEPGLKEGAFYDPLNFTFPMGCFICEVEIDPDTGKTEILKFVASDDFGVIINPMIVEGQVHGGIAQGVGQALLEEVVYNEDGQQLSASYMDYTMPRADDVPNYDVLHHNTKCTTNPLGIKGCGEAGAIGSPPAVINAITNAIGNNDLSMPATPSKVWALIHSARMAAE